MKIGTYISELLFDHDHVILPGFGEFYTRYIPARFLPEEKKILSPAKVISFSADTTQGETPLISFMAHKENQSLEQVQQLISDFVSEMNASLARGQKVLLDRVGFFSRDAEGIINFEPDISINYLADAAGMGTVSEPQKISAEPTKPPLTEPFDGTESDPVSQKLPESVAAETPAEPIEDTSNTWTHPEIEPDPEIPHPEMAGPELPKAIKWLAWFIIPVTVVAIILAFNWSFIFGKRSKAPVAPQHTEAAAPDLAQHDEASTIATPETQPATATPAPDVAARPAASGQPDAGRKVYHIVVGAFQDQGQANRFVEELRAKGANQAGIFMQTSTGFHRVSYGFFYNLNEAEAQLKKVQQQINPSAWILQKN